MENFTPPTQAELDEWKKIYTSGSNGSRNSSRVLRLIIEVEELRKDKERLQSILAVTEMIAELSCKAVRDSAMQQKGEE